MQCAFLLFLVLLIACAYAWARWSAAQRRREARRRALVAWCAETVRRAREAL